MVTTIASLPFPLLPPPATRSALELGISWYTLCLSVSIPLRRPCGAMMTSPRAHLSRVDSLLPDIWTRSDGSVGAGWAGINTTCRGIERSSIFGEDSTLITAEPVVRISGEISERHDARPLSVNANHANVGETRMA